MLIIDGVFNRIFPVMSVVSVYYCIGNPLLHIYPTSTLWWFYFSLLSPFNYNHDQLMFRTLVKDLYNFIFVLPDPSFLFATFLSSFFYPFCTPLHTKHDTPYLKLHKITFSFLTITPQFTCPLKISHKISENYVLYLLLSWWWRKIPDRGWHWCFISKQLKPVKLCCIWM